MFEAIMRKLRKGPAKPQQLTAKYEGQVISYILTRDRFKTIRLSVARDGAVTEKIPYCLSDEQARTFLEERLPWIAEKIRLQKKRDALPDFAFRDGDIIYYFGRPLALSLTVSAGRTEVRRDKDRLEIHARSICPTSVRAAVQAWRRKTSQAYLTERLRMTHAALSGQKGAPLYGTECPSVEIRVLKRRFGSCSSKGIVTLALHLTAFPPELIDFIICHELCHLKFMDHSRGFYELLSRCDPYHREHKKQINELSLTVPHF